MDADMKVWSQTEYTKVVSDEGLSSILYFSIPPSWDAVTMAARAEAILWPRGWKTHARARAKKHKDLEYLKASFELFSSRLHVSEMEYTSLSFDVTESYS